MTDVAAPTGRYAYHIPKCKPGEICRCGKPFESHRVEHQPYGDPCIKCGLPSEKHYRKHPAKDRDKQYCVGIDGEGQGRADHQYVMLAYSNASGSICNAIESAEGKALTTIECLDFILSIPQNAKIFAFAFQYDLTKILGDCDDSTLYRLWRPDLRQRPPDKQHLGPIPVVWNGYVLNMLGSKFSVEKAGRRRVIWDCFKFFQAKFTKALEDWKVASAEVLSEMRAMKDQRGDFDKLNRSDILRYCYSECSKMAELAKRLIDAHRAAGLTLRSYHGAGSTASCVLKLMRIDKAKRIGPQEMDHAVASAFFGGRFENRLVGVIKGPLYSRDISSAYPYQTTFLPCLECGAWTLTRKPEALEMCTTALVHYRLGKAPSGLVWGPLPFRSKEGSICFPATSGGGWVWLAEYQAALAAFPHVEFVEAYIYNTLSRASETGQGRSGHCYQIRDQCHLRQAGAVQRDCPTLPVMDLGRHDHQWNARRNTAHDGPSQRPAQSLHDRDRWHLHSRKFPSAAASGNWDIYGETQKASRRMGNQKNRRRHVRRTAWYLLPSKSHSRRNCSSASTRSRSQRSPAILAKNHRCLGPWRKNRHSRQCRAFQRCQIVNRSHSRP
jgi:hypothetical protein